MLPIFRPQSVFWGHSSAAVPIEDGRRRKGAQAAAPPRRSGTPLCMAARRHETRGRTDVDVLDAVVEVGALGHGGLRGAPPVSTQSGRAACKASPPGTGTDSRRVGQSSRCCGPCRPSRGPRCHGWPASRHGPVRKNRVRHKPLT